MCVCVCAHTHLCGCMCVRVCVCVCVLCHAFIISALSSGFLRGCVEMKKGCEYTDFV